MKMQASLLLVGAGMALGLFAATLPAAAQSTAMQSCSDDWAKMKAAGSIPEGQTWPKFWSQCAKDYAAANPSEDAAPAAKSTTGKAADSKAAKAKPAEKPAEPAAGGGKSTAMASCSADWAKMKEAGTIPAGQTWPKFWSQCAKDYAAANPSEDAAPAAKAAKGKAAKAADSAIEADEGIALPDPEQAAKMNTAAKTAGKRPLTPGQQAAIVRIRACGAEWQERKAAGKLPQGAKWPQYWSDCNKRLKAKGQ
jgi:hypothetical protein